MQNTVLNTTAIPARELTDSEIDTVCGGTSHFIAALAAVILNAVDPSANCVVADNNKVVCLK